MANIVPRNTTGHGRGGEIAVQSVPPAAFFQPLRPSDTSPIFCCAKHRGVVRFVQKFKQEPTFYRKVRSVFVDKWFIAKIHAYPTDFLLN